MSNNNKNFNSPNEDFLYFCSTNWVNKTVRVFTVDNKEISGNLYTADLSDSFDLILKKCKIKSKGKDEIENIEIIQIPLNLVESIDCEEAKENADWRPSAKDEKSTDSHLARPEETWRKFQNVKQAAKDDGKWAKPLVVSSGEERLSMVKISGENSAEENEPTSQGSLANPLKSPNDLLNSLNIDVPKGRGGVLGLSAEKDGKDDGNTSAATTQLKEVPEFVPGVKEFVPGKPFIPAEPAPPVPKFKPVVSSGNLAKISLKQSLLLFAENIKSGAKESAIWDEARDATFSEYVEKIQSTYQPASLQNIVNQHQQMHYDSNQMTLPMGSHGGNLQAPMVGHGAPMGAPMGGGHMNMSRGGQFVSAFNPSAAPYYSATTYTLPVQIAYPQSNQQINANSANNGYFTQETLPNPSPNMTTAAASGNLEVIHK